jgi:hypothetical protein
MHPENHMTFIFVKILLRSEAIRRGVNRNLSKDKKDYSKKQARDVISVKEGSITCIYIYNPFENNFK